MVQLLSEKLKLTQQVLEGVCQMVGHINCNPTYGKFLSIYGDTKVRLAQLKMQSKVITRAEFLTQLRQCVAVRAQAQTIMNMRFQVT